MLRRLLLPLLAFLSGCYKPLFSPDKAPGFNLVEWEPKHYVYVPKAWSADKQWPVIVYLHGQGESGIDPVRPTQVGLGPVVWKSDGAFPAIVIFPQAPEHTYWGMPDNNERVLHTLDEVMKRYNGDPARVYLTGNSLGGFGTWFLGALHPERFAALVPICGGVRGKAPRPDAPFAAIPEDQRAAEVARRIGPMPVWAFHGAKDWLVPVAYSREITDAIKKAGGNVQYTEYPDLGHNSWDRAYGNPALFDCLFAQHK